jgi:hypothetical protein
MKRAVVFVTALAASVVAGAAHAGQPEPPSPPQTLKLGYFSEQSGATRSVIGASINASRERAGRTAAVATSTQRSAEISSHRRGVSTPSSVEVRLNPYPALRSDSPLLHDRTPAGPGSLWYSDGSGHACMYAPDSVLPCFTLVAPPGASAPGTPAVAPAAVAASVADRMPLSPGEIHASPDTRGLTGAASWFWLDPAPRATSLSVALAGERVTVTAEPDSVQWRFGDGGAFFGGAGVPYRPGPPPPEAVTHTYGTRCLPGDQGRNPYVLASCGQDGYTVEAVVSWRISYGASGPVRASGGLPARTTEASAVYPVGEARAFLLGGGSQ